MISQTGRKSNARPSKTTDDATINATIDSFVTII